MASFDKPLTILSVDPTDADELLEIGMRHDNNENMLLVVPLIPEGNKEVYKFCDRSNYDKYKSYEKAYKAAYWLAKAFPDIIVYVDQDIVDERNPVSQEIYYHLANDMPDIDLANTPKNLSICLNELKMFINIHSTITTNIGRPATGFVYLMNKLGFTDKVTGPIYVQGGSVWGSEAGTTNLPNLFNRTPRESMNLARNPIAFMELVKQVKGNIVVVPTAYSIILPLASIRSTINNVYISKEQWVNIPYMMEHEFVKARDILNQCCKKYYSQDRFSKGAKLFDVDLYKISVSNEDWLRVGNYVKMKCAIKKGLGEMELHKGELDGNKDYEHFPEVTVIIR